MEATVIRKLHPTAGEQIKGFVIYGLPPFCILKQGQQETPDLINGLQDHVLQELGKIAVPREIAIVASLPETRSGKIIRRVLKPKELGQDPGDIFM